MHETVIKVENLSKQYRLGEVSTGSLAHDVNRLWYKIRGKENPYLKISESNDRASKGKSDYVWALKDINFEVKKGEILGIIGRNGAGKSTLLKILSRTTAPTTGSVKIRGRVASLLEVGTGFHPELSGRDNIYLNGAILGMTRKEIARKFDEIVDFAGVERYIDTPVKRYSSGMYVRLAFGVAAHLEPEILIVDEVLAVGDAEFQKKCLGKMKDVSGKDGRTVLFVSHNMQAVGNLCNDGLVMQEGKIMFAGDAGACISNYISNFIQKNTLRKWERKDAPGNIYSRMLMARVFNPITDSLYDFNTKSGFVLEFEIDNLVPELQQLDITYHLVDERGTLVKVASTGMNGELSYYRESKILFRTFFPGGILNEGIYTLSRVLLLKNRGTIITEWNDLLSFEVLPENHNQLGWQGQKEGVIKLTDLVWEINTDE